jgi:uncharacterized protein YjiS (DUF1127 family)
LLGAAAVDWSDGRARARPKEEVMSTSSTYRFTHVARSPAPGRAVWARARAGLAGLIGALAREREIRRSMKHLASLDDHALRDIGLTRGDIERVVRFGRD